MWARVSKEKAVFLFERLMVYVVVGDVRGVGCLHGCLVGWLLSAVTCQMMVVCVCVLLLLVAVIIVIVVVLGSGLCSAFAICCLLLL